MTSSQRTSPGGAAVLMVALAALLRTAGAEALTPLANGVRPTNLLGGPEQHASFSLIRPGLTQTAFAFNGPSSHQQFSSSVGDPHLANRLLPNLAHALAYRNPGLGYHPVQAPIQTGYAATAAGPVVAYQPSLFDYHHHHHQPLAHAYQHQIHPYHQQYQQQPYPAGFAQQVQAQQVADQNAHQAQLGQQYFAARLQSNAEAQPAEAVPEQIQLQQQQHQERQTANLLGVAYSAAPSVAHVKVAGGGYKFDF